jgi:TonB family protein
MEAGAIFSYVGSTLTKPPQNVLLIIRSESGEGILSGLKEWMFLDVRDLTFLVDSKPLTIGKMQHEGKVRDDAGVIENLSINIPTEAFLRIVNAKDVEMQVGIFEMKLSESHLEALRDLASRMNPQSQTQIEEKMSTPEPSPVPIPDTPQVGRSIKGKLVSKPMPVYPKTAKAARASGTVTVRVDIDEEGKVVNATATYGHPLLTQAAIEAALQARFEPTLVAGKPTRTTGTLVYTFRL